MKMARDNNILQLIFQKHKRRTGCAGCPFGKRFEYELEVMKKYEPMLYRAVVNIFGNSYDYTRKYYEFKNKKR